VSSDAFGRRRADPHQIQSVSYFEDPHKGSQAIRDKRRAMAEEPFAPRQNPGADGRTEDRSVGGET